MREDAPRGFGLLAGTFGLAAVLHVLHEVAHMVTAVAFGASGSMGTNTVRFTSEMSDAAVIGTTAAGPGLMLVFAALAFRSRSRWSASVLFIVVVQRAMAAMFSALMTPNDEARLSIMFGLGPWALFAITVGLTGALFILRYRRESLGWKWIAISYLGFSMALTMVVFGDGLLRIQF